MAKQKYKFERLTPIDNMDLDVYEEAIDYVFSNSDVKNVAISGAYSAGKSSVLASYKKKHDELRFLHMPFIRNAEFCAVFSYYLGFYTRA